MTTQQQIDDFYRHQAGGMQNAVPSWQSPPVTTPAPPPGLPWGYVCGWVVTGLILFSGVWWLVEKAIRP